MVVPIVGYSLQSLLMGVMFLFVVDGLAAPPPADGPHHFEGPVDVPGFTCVF
jgi:hypothetical protein